jgi:predicted nucleic acid-binding protein
MTLDERDEAESLLNLFPTIEIDRFIARTAGDILGHKQLKFADAVIAATAITRNATVLTNDKDLLGFSYPGYAVEKVGAFPKKPPLPT